MPGLTVLVHVTRDSVCMGDDVDAPHEQTLEIAGNQSPEAILREVIRRYPLASIAGGKATWVCKVAGKPVAVIAQQWKEPEFRTLPAGIPDETRIHFTYHSQQPPEQFPVS